MMLIELAATIKPVDPPRLYVLNANSLAKQRAVTHLTHDLVRYDADVAVITETHLNQGDTDKNLTVRGYRLLRRDRVGRRGGGVAIYSARQVLIRHSLP